MYDYKKRTSELSRILKISDADEKVRRLGVFISDEIKILNNMENPLLRSQALDLAKHCLESLKNDIPYATLTP